MNNYINLLCSPENNMDCYYNINWKQNNYHNLKNKPTINNFTILQNKINNKMIEFILSAQPSNDIVLNNLIQFRASYFNKSNYNFTIQNLVSKIRNIATISDLAYVVRLLNQSYIPNVCNIFVISNKKNPSVYVCNIGEVVLSLADKTDYDVNSNSLINFYTCLTHIHDFLLNTWQYHANSNNFIENVLLFEILASQQMLNPFDAQNPQLIDNTYAYIDFINKYDVDDFWKIVLTDTAHVTDYISIDNVHYFVFIAKLLKHNQIVILRDYLMYCVLCKFGIYTSIAPIIYKIDSNNYDNQNIFINLFYDMFGYYLQSVFEKSNNNSQKIENAHEIFLTMKKFCIQYFKKNSLFSKYTNAHAITKLNYLDIVIGRPLNTIDLTHLPKLSDDFYNNILMVSNYYYKHTVQWIGKAVHREYISINNDIYSFILNAYYDPRSNMIYLPTSILTDIFYCENGDPIYNYGGIGAVIGHELMHSFDNYGSQYDEIGHLRNWWTPFDYVKYNNELAKVKNHYSRISVNGHLINSNTSIGENIADIGGLKLALRTYLSIYYSNNYRNGHLINLSKTQRQHIRIFFQRWAIIFRSVNAQQLIDYLIKVDVHAPDMVRINAPLAHINEFYEIFSIKPGDNNYLDANSRTKFLDLY